MEEFFIITREGVYRHEILGVFDKRYQAEMFADAIAKVENDDYHAIVVSSGVLGVVLKDVEPVSNFRKGSKPEILKPQTSGEADS